MPTDIFLKKSSANQLIRTIVFWTIALQIFLLTINTRASSAPTGLLTSAEQQWLSENQSRITLAVETGYPPFAFLDGQNNPAGLANDYLQLMESKLGAHFKQKQFATLSDIFIKVHSGDVQIVNAVTKTPERSEFLAFTSPFISIPNVIIVRDNRYSKIQENDLAGLKVSLVKNYAVTEHLLKNKSGLTADIVPDDLSAILRVSFGRSDAAVIDLATASYLIEQKGITNLRVAGEASLPIQLAIGVPRTETVLHSILQKALESITAAERQEIESRWIHLSQQSFFADRRLRIAAAIMILAGLGITGGFIAWGRMLQRQVLIRTAELSQEKEALRLSEKHHRTILQTAMDGIWQVDRQGRLLEVNESYCTMSGYSREELLTMSISDLDVDESADDVKRHIKEVMSEGLCRFEARHRRKDGTVYDVEVSTQYQDINDGNLVCFLRDITTRKVTEKALWQEKAFLRALIDSAVDLIYFKDRNGCYLGCNKASEKFIGIPEQSQIGQSDFDLFNLEQAEEIVKSDRRVLETGLVARMEEWVTLPDSRRVLLDTVKAPIFGQDHQLVGLVGISRDITEKVKMATALEKSEQSFFAIFEASPIPLALNDDQGNITALNRAFVHTIGYTQDDIPTLDEWWPRAYPDPHYRKLVADNWKNAIEESIRSGNAFIPQEANICCKDGSIRTFVISAASLEARFSGTHLVVMYDITAIKQAESNLLASEGRFRAVFERSTVGKSLTAVDGTLLQINKAFADMLGYTIEEIQQRNFVQITHPDDVAISKAYIRALLANEQSSCRFEKRYIHKDGSIVYADVSTTLLRDDQEEPLCLITSIVDITKSKQSEEELRRNERRMASLFEISQYPFTTEQAFLDHALNEVIKLTHSKIGYIYFYNEQTRKFTLNTWSKEVMRECSVVEQQSTYDLDRTGIWGEAVRQRLPIMLNEFAADNPLKKGIPEGHVKLSKFLTVPVFIDREIVAVVGVANKESDYSNTDVLQLNLFMDAVWKVAAYKRAEAERLILTDQLHQAQKMESVGRLAGGVAHDFNNMLSVILGYSEMLLMRCTPDQPVYSPLKEISAAATRSAELTRQLLAFARKQTILPKVIDLNDSITGMLKMLQRLIGENIQLTWRPEKNLWPVLMDTSQVDQILANLCVNARDAISGIGNIVIETGICSIDESYCKYHIYALLGDYVKIVVSDDGTGMDKKTLEHIFEPFFTTKAIGTGTGLGLATVYGIVRQNKGFINVDSEPGSGTTFTIYLPRYKGAVEQAGSKTARDPMQCGEETILLVEDEASILEMTATLLSEIGYTVLKANSPVEAIRLASEYPAEIDLLVTDVIMPEMNGRDLSLAIMAIYPKIKHLFMSGYTSDIIATSGIMAENVAFIQKPFQLSSLAAKLREVLDRSDTMAHDS